MAFALLGHEVRDLTLGKPALPWLASSSSSVRDALLALKLLPHSSELSVWNCFGHAHSHCRCLGKICMQKIVCYLASDHSLSHPSLALSAPVSVLLPSDPPLTVQHVEPHSSLLDALDLIVAGAQNLVVPIPTHATKYSVPHNPNSLSHDVLPKSHNGREYCWLTQEDVLRFLLGRISVFSPLPMMSIEDLGIINTDVLMVEVEEPAVSALEMIKAACRGMTAVAVVETANESTELVGEISCSTLQTCNETAALALATLTAGDFLSFIQDFENPPEVLASIVRSRIHEKVGSMKEAISKPGSELHGVLDDPDVWEESSDDEFGADSPTGHHDLSRRWFSGHTRASGRMGCSTKNRSAPIFCRPRSSLIAVIVQALAHREHYVWVTAEDDTLVGIVTLLDILTVLLNHLDSST